MLKHHSKSMRFVIAATLITVLLAPAAWAYKVEKICEDLPATAKEPAQKKCKVVRVKEAAPSKGDGKGDGKGDAKADPKKDAK
jgi:hypothetical protein